MTAPLSQLERLEAEATSGEWTVNPFYAGIVSDRFGKDGDFLPIALMLWPTDERTEAETYANAALIVALRNALPSLLSTTRTQASDLERMRVVVATSADLLEQYASFIREDVKADDLERHPYLPLIESTVEDARAALSLNGETGRG